MLYLDLVTYLPDDILAKVDRATMACSLEAREPLLDYRLVEFAWRLPGSLNNEATKANGCCGKSCISMSRPRWWIAPKRVSPLRLPEWLRGPMRECAEHHLGESHYSQEGFFDSRQIRERWQEHLPKNGIGPLDCGTC